MADIFHVWPYHKNSEAQSPWDSISPFVEMLPSETGMPAWLFRPDIFHNWHLGAGKYFISSSLVILQKFEVLFPGGGVDARFQSMTAQWLEFCKARKDAHSKQNKCCNLKCFLCFWGADRFGFASAISFLSIIFVWH